MAFDRVLVPVPNGTTQMSTGSGIILVFGYKVRELPRASAAV